MLSSTAISLLLLAFAGAATCRPAWYRPAAVDPVRLNDDKRDLVNLADAIGDALNAGEPIEFELAEDQLNRWIVARGEIWPAWQIELQGVSLPQISLLAGDRVRIAATLSGGPVEPVMSVIGRTTLTPDEISIKLESVRSGLLPLPHSRFLGPFSDSLDPASDRVRLADGVIRVRNYWVWENGERPFRITRLEIKPGLARVRLEPAQ